MISIILFSISRLSILSKFLISVGVSALIGTLQWRQQVQLAPELGFIADDTPFRQIGMLLAGMIIIGAIVTAAIAGGKIVWRKFGS